MLISFRQKTAGKKEAKKVSGLNFEEIRKRLIAEGIDPTRDEIMAKMLDEGYLVISEKQKNTINSIDISESQRKRVSEVESALIVIGAVLSNESESDAKSDIEVFEWYLETFEFQPGKLGISDSDIKDIISIKKAYEKIYSEVADEKRKADEAERATSDDDYLSNEIVYDLREGWRVVYVPAAGEMEPFPGYPNTSHDRVLEGDKNGLCLGSGMRYYQNNEAGKIYSVRDPSNKPRVTIRILNNQLEEAKGKNNNPPDISGAEKADIWFKTIKDFSYKNSNDYKSFPPLNIKDAKDLFHRDPYSAYLKGWVTYWYKKGIEELDKDMDEKISANHPILIESGFGKHPAFFEKIKPTVIYWCNKYIDEDSENARKILFSSRNNNEVFKTYKKLNEMNLAVKKFASNTNMYAMYFYLGLHEIREYGKYIDTPAKEYLEHDPLSFIKSFYNKNWAQKYMSLAGEFLSKKLNPFDLLIENKEEPWFELFMPQIIMSAINNDPVAFIEKFKNKSWAKEYLALAGAGYAKKDPKNFIYLLSKFEWAIPSLDVAGRSLAESEPEVIIANYSKDWAKSNLELAAMNLIEKNPFSFLIYAYLQEMRPYIDKAVNAALEKKPCYFLREYSNNDWAKPYLDLARKKCAEISPMNFMLNSKEDPLSKPYIELAIKNLVYGSDSLIETNPESFLRYFSKEDWAKPYLSFAAKKYLEIGEDPFKFIKLHSTEPWAKPHLDFAAKQAIDFDPDYFLMSFKDRERDRGWVGPYIELAMEKSIEKKDDINLFANTYKNKLNIIKKLSLALRGLGLKSEASTIENLLGIPLYHGTDETFSLGKWKISKSGALGAGIYLTPSRERAKSYGRNVIRAHASLEKPIIVDVGLAEGVDADPCIAALKALGVSEKAAISRVEKAYDERGYVSTGIKAVGEKLGYDGIMLYNKGELKEVVVWNAARISGAEIE